ncbi:hypothetical protein ACIQ9Q_09525 [Streptomyces sp. NPDC094438]|uniref:hypothetical protein n=1 Tax=Streptomyces sp. NPDC094438 TaxID=3366061 RepID=UPI00380F8EBF
MPKMGDLVTVKKEPAEKYYGDPEAEAYEDFHDRIKGIFSNVIAQRYTEEEGWSHVADALTETREAIQALREKAKGLPK